MKNDIDYEALEEKLKGTPVPNPKVFYGRNKRGNNSAFKSVVIKNIVRKETVTVGGKATKQIKTFNAESIKNALYYIGKEAEQFKNDNDEIVNVNDILQEWDESLSKDPKHSEALHYVFSIDEDKNSNNYEALEKAARDTFSLFFSDYKYVTAVHKHQGKPHIHVIINKHNIHTNKKFTFKTKQDTKDFFHDMRENFKDNLNRYNGNFNYRNNYRVEKNLIQLMMKDELKLMTTKDNFIKEIQSDVKQEIRVLKDFHNQVETTRELNFKNVKFTSDSKVALHNINQVLQQEKKLDKQSQRALEKIKLKEIFSSNLDELKKSDQLIDFQNHINYFESPAQKRMMGFFEYSKYSKIKKGFEQFKFNYDKEFKNKIFVEDKETIKFLSTRTNSWNINKQLKLINNRRMEYAKLYNNIDKVVVQQLDKNYEDMISLFKARADHVPVLIKDYESQLKYEKDSKKYESIKKSIETLNKELEYIGHIQSNENSIKLSQKDHTKLINEFIEKVSLVNESTSAFKINKLILEAEHHKENKTFTKELEKDFNKSTRDLKISIEIRQMKLIKNIVNMSRMYLDENNLEKKEELKGSLEFFKKENDFIVENHTKDVQKLCNNLNRKMIVIDENTSAYNLDKMIIEAQYYKELKLTTNEIKEQLDKDIKKLEKDITYRREKVFENIITFERKISDEKDPQKIKDLQGNLEFFKKEHKFIMKHYIKDEKQLVKELVGKVNHKEENISAFKLDKLVCEANHHKQLKSLNKEDIESLDHSIEKLHKSLKVRKSKVVYAVESITSKIQNEKNGEELKKMDESRDYFIKEHKFIQEHYKQVTQNQQKRENIKER